MKTRDPLTLLGYELTWIADRWMSGTDAAREIGAVLTVFEDDDSLVGARWKVALDYGDNLRLMTSAPTLADAEGRMCEKLRAVSRWSLRIARGKEPPHDCLACGFDGSTLGRNEPPLRALAACPYVDPRIREDAAQRLARRTAQK